MTSLGVGFKDADFGFDTRTGLMSITTLAWTAHVDAYRSSFTSGFVGGDFEAPDGSRIGASTQLLLEWTSELSFRKVMTRGASLDFFGATMWTRNEAAAVDARQAGIGLRVSSTSRRLGTTIFYRRIVGEQHDYRFRTDWNLPIEFRDARLLLTGYQDVVFGPGRLPETSGFPAAYVDTGPITGLPLGQALLGIRWFDHRSREWHTTAPQVALRLTF